MAFPISVTLPPELRRVDLETAARRSRLNQWRRHPGHLFRVRGDELRGRTSVGTNRLKNPARLRAQLMDDGGRLRLEGSFHIWPFIETVLGVAVVALLLGFIASIRDGVLSGILVCGGGAALLGVLIGVAITQRAQDAEQGIDETMEALRQGMSPEGRNSPAR